MRNTTPVAIITGAGSGIGRATSHILAAAGYRLVLAGRRVKNLRDTAAACDAECMIVRCDVRDEPDLNTLVASAKKGFGRVDVLVNNAAEAPSVPIAKTTPKLFERVMRTNVHSVATLTRLVWPIFVKQKRGCIVNISSIAAIDPFPGFFAYAASKAAVSMLTASTSREGRDLGIRAFAIAPGAVETPMLRAIFTKDQIPARDALDPTAVAHLVRACVDGRHDHLTGQTLPILSKADREGWFQPMVKQRPAAWMSLDFKP